VIIAIYAAWSLVISFRAPTQLTPNVIYLTQVLQALRDVCSSVVDEFIGRTL
jgi:hypothetical protein